MDSKKPSRELDRRNHHPNLRIVLKGFHAVPASLHRRRRYSRTLDHGLDSRHYCSNVFVDNDSGSILGPVTWLFGGGPNPCISDGNRGLDHRLRGSGNRCEIYFRQVGERPSKPSGRLQLHHFKVAFASGRQHHHGHSDFCWNTRVGYSWHNSGNHVLFGGANDNNRRHGRAGKPFEKSPFG